MKITVMTDLHCVDGFRKQFAQSRGKRVLVGQERVEQLARSGIPFEHGPRNQPWMWREARLRDPDGNIIFLYKAGEARRFPPWRMES